MYLYNVIFIEHSVILDIKLLYIVHSSPASAICRDTWAIAEAEQVNTAALLGLVRGQAEAAGPVLFLLLAVSAGLEARVVRNPTWPLPLQKIKEAGALLLGEWRHLLQYCGQHIKAEI